MQFIKFRLKFLTHLKIRRLPFKFQRYKPLRIFTPIRPNAFALNLNRSNLKKKFKAANLKFTLKFQPKFYLVLFLDFSCASISFATCPSSLPSTSIMRSATLLYIFFLSLKSFLAAFKSFKSGRLA